MSKVSVPCIGSVVNLYFRLVNLCITDFFLIQLLIESLLLFSGRHGAISMLSIFSNIVQQEHIRGLWRGMTPVSKQLTILYFC